MSANLIVDLGNTTDFQASVVTLSGTQNTVGRIVDLLYGNTNCNIFVASHSLSGVLPIWIQTSDGTTSGSFTDPTSGLAQLPDGISSGGILWANSGLYSSGIGSPGVPALTNVPLMCSGGIQFGHFQRPHRYARLIYSGTVALPVDAMIAGFITQKKITGSGGGFSWSPQSGTSISV